ncbi:MAG: isopentenyl transferase family protein, partial [Patescibacteria group bacterium]
MKLIAIVGPTASGKSELAVFLAKQIKKAEIISADSRQVYKYLDIGTNKVSGKWQMSKNKQVYLPAIASKCTCFIYKGISHYCIDFVHPRKTFTVVEFAQCAKRAIQEIREHGNIPILAGGTGFYIQAVVDDITIPEVMPDLKLRKKLEKMPVEKLFKMLEGLDSRRAEAIDSKNPRRLIRAIEII